jgi:hypothetical protein
LTLHGKRERVVESISNSGGGRGTRTPDLDSAIVALSQLSYAPTFAVGKCTEPETLLSSKVAAPRSFPAFCRYRLLNAPMRDTLSTGSPRPRSDASTFLLPSHRSR